MSGFDSSKPSYKWGKAFIVCLIVLAFGVRIALEGDLSYSDAVLDHEVSSGVIHSNLSPWRFWGLVGPVIAGGFFGAVFTGFGLLRARKREKNA